MRNAFARLRERTLAHMGEPCVLRGEEREPPALAAIRHGVESQGADGAVQYHRVAFWLSEALAPRTGDSLVFAGVHYRLDSRLRDDGLFVMFSAIPI